MKKSVIEKTCAKVCPVVAELKSANKKLFKELEAESLESSRLRVQVVDLEYQVRELEASIDLNDTKARLMDKTHADLRLHNEGLVHDLANLNTLAKDLEDETYDLKAANTLLKLQVEGLREEREASWDAIAKVQNAVIAFQAERCNSKNSKITGGP